MEFRNMEELVRRVNFSLGDFNGEFSKTRKLLKNARNAISKNQLFKYAVSSRDWAINKGGGTEVQYYLGFSMDSLTIRYGLGFNTQYVQYANEMSMVQYMKPYMDAFVLNQNKIEKILPEYSFVIGTIDQLIKPKLNQYTLFGKSVLVENQNGTFYLKDEIFNKLIENLKSQLEVYKLIFANKQNNAGSDMKNNSIIELLKLKKQIILQGPPGTGKTREAKLLARSIVLTNNISSDGILDTINIGLKIKSSSGQATYEIEEIDNSKVILRIESGTRYTVTFDEIIKAYREKLWEGGLIGGTDSYKAALAKYIYENIDCSPYLRLIQFHPAYSYEDFVRGIVVKTDISSMPEYKTVNKVLAEFAKKANESNLKGGIDDFDRAWYELVEDINNGKVTKIGSSDIEVDVNSQGNIKFKTPVATYEKTYELYRFGKTDLKYETYNKIVLNFLKDKKGKYQMKDFVSPTSISSNQSYVLVIDEINRANLPAVLGELIYALEYRGEKVESMYATTEEGNTLILPPNLYIIGTMNTSDRSVGHIDYAIRRRFAFIDVLPKVLEGDSFELELFKNVSALFIQNLDEYLQDNTVELKLSEHLSDEFRPEDVCEPATKNRTKS